MAEHFKPTAGLHPPDTWPLEGIAGCVGTGVCKFRNPNRLLHDSLSCCHLAFAHLLRLWRLVGTCWCGRTGLRACRWQVEGDGQWAAGPSKAPAPPHPADRFYLLSRSSLFLLPCPSFKDPSLTLQQDRRRPALPTSGHPPTSSRSTCRSGPSPPPLPAANSFAGGSYGSAGGMGCQSFGSFDGLPAEMRRSVSGRIFLDDAPLLDAQPCVPGESLKREAASCLRKARLGQGNSLTVARRNREGIQHRGANSGGGSSNGASSFEPCSSHPPPTNCHPLTLPTHAVPRPLPRHCQGEGAGPLPYQCAGHEF